MLVRNAVHKIAYYSVPKVATSSIMLALYALESPDDPLVAARDIRAIHGIYRARNRAEARNPPDLTGYWRFAVVRDPIERLFSLYTNRVLEHGDTRRGRFPRLRAAVLGLTLDPTPDQFFVNLARYRLQSSGIRHHTQSFATEIGTELARLDRVYRMDELPTLGQDLSERTGHPVSFGSFQTSPKRLTLADLSPAAARALMAATRAEYAYLRDYCAPPSLPGAS